MKLKLITLPNIITLGNLLCGTLGVVSMVSLQSEQALYTAFVFMLAAAMCEAVYDVDPEIIFMGLAGSKMITAAEKTGLKTASEVFADRAYNDDGTLVSRKLPGAMIKDRDLAIRRVVRMVKEGQVTTINGNEIAIRADSICVHGDNPKALEFVKNIRETLIAEGVEIKSLMA